MELFPAEVKYCLNHFGHDEDIGKLPLSKEEKDKLAGKLIVGITPQNILCNIAENEPPERRLACTNMQDLKNISSSYGLETRHQNDFISVDSWVREISENKENPILLYKLPGDDKNNFSNLEPDDFVLGYMSDAQESILKSFGADVICIDSTHGTNQYGIQLNTILVR